MNTILGAGDTDSLFLSSKQQSQEQKVCKRPSVSNSVCGSDVLLKKNFLSEFLTEEEKQKARKNLGISKQLVTWADIEGSIYDNVQMTELIESIGTKLQELRTDIDNKVTKDIEEIKTNVSQIEDTLVVGLDTKINKEFTDTNKAVEQIGYTVQGKSFQTVQDALDSLFWSAPSYTSSKAASCKNNNYYRYVTDASQNNFEQIQFSREISEFNINSYELAVDDLETLTSKTYTLNPLKNISTSDNKTFRIDDLFSETPKGYIKSIKCSGTAKDGTRSFNWSVNVNCVSTIYYKVSANKPDIPTINWVGSRKAYGDFSCNTGVGQYIWVYIPNSITSDPKFYVGGFEGGFTKVESIPALNNETYTLYRSDNPNLGSITVNLK